MKIKKFERKKIGEICKLSELAIGQSAVIVKINGTNAFIRRRLFDMGITCGVVVEIKKLAPLGDPVGIKIRGYELCLRKSELKNVEARVV